MKTEKNILIAFLLNLAFSVFEFAGGFFTGSVAIVSDALHDMGDALSIGISYFLEKKSKKKPDEKYTYGYARYSVFGSMVTTLILVLGSIAVIYNAVNRIINPVPINHNGMIIMALFGVCVNSCAVFFTREGGSLNQKAVNLHMIEDVLGWIVVLIGAAIMRFTNLYIIDPLMSIGVSIFILVNAFKNLKETTDLLLEKIPCGINVKEIKELVLGIDGILDVHHIHIWSLDGQTSYATMHIMTNSEPHQIKEMVRDVLKEHGILHTTLELEEENEHCHQKECCVESASSGCHHHHHHH